MHFLYILYMLLNDLPSGQVERLVSLRYAIGVIANVGRLMLALWANTPRN
jgi:hypothetical protein